MYAHFKFTNGVKRTIVRYPFEDPPHIIDATVVVVSKDQTFRTLSDLAMPGDKCCLVTVSLPAGRDMSDPDARVLMRRAIKDRGVELDTVPFILGKHVQTPARHFHFVFLDRMFTGQPIRVDTSILTTQASHRRLAIAYGLPVPEYFDPDAVPTLRPPVIQRRTVHNPTAKELRKSPWTTGKKDIEKAARWRLNQDLLRVFKGDLPSDLRTFNVALDRIGSEFRICLGPGKPAKATYATIATPQLFLNSLGPAWEVAPTQARMAFAERVIQLQPILALRFLLRAHLFNPTKDIPNDDRRHTKVDIPDTRGIARAAIRQDGGLNRPGFTGEFLV